MEHQRADDPAMQTVRELATHSADIRHLQTDMDKMTKDMEEIKDAIREISKTLSEAKGGWKLLLVVGGIGASVATFVTWAIDMAKH
jgi:prefoldin subunit 5